MQISRRESLKILGVAIAAVAAAPLLSCARLLRKNLPNFPLSFAKSSPINRLLPDVAEKEYYGDQPHRAHPILWDKPSFLKKVGGLPAPTEKHEIVIVGGGMSGLFSAYLLRKYQPLILEQAAQFGGNAKGQSWRGIDYSIGAAYFMEHEEGSKIKKLFEELDLYSLCKVKTENDPVFLQKKYFEHFWQGETDPSHKDDFIRLSKHFEDMGKNSNGLKYPKIPFSSKEDEEYVKNLDSESFRTYMERINQGPLHPHIATALEHYCWSTLGTGMNELSAAQALNAYASEFGLVYVAPGGNAKIAEAILARLWSEIGEKQLRAQSLVVDIRKSNEKVFVSYLNGAGNLQTIETKVCIVACPKFIAKKIIDKIPLEQKAAMEKIQYHPYLVANVCIAGSINKNFYDAFLLENGVVNLNNPEKSSRQDRTTDIVLANYATADANHTVLTLYRPLPWKGARAELYAPDSYNKITAEFSAEIKNEILPLLEIDEKKLQDIRIARWGHPIPVARPQMIKDGILKMAHQPIENKIFFIEQDNWALAAIETAAEEAIHWSEKISEILG